MVRKRIIQWYEGEERKQVDISLLYCFFLSSGGEYGGGLSYTEENISETKSDLCEINL